MIVAYVAGRRLRVSDHALERYSERVRPTLAGPELEEEMRRMLQHAELQTAAPAWAQDGEADEWAVLTDAIAFPIREGYLATCLTRNEPGDEMRVVRSRERRQRAERQRAPGVQKKHGKVLREARARRRAMKAGEFD